MRFHLCFIQILRGSKAECPEVFDPADCYYLAETDHYYIVESESKKTFEGAQMACSELGGELARIDSPKEHAFLSGLANIQGAWLGMQKINNEWVWLGDKTPVCDINDEMPLVFLPQ